MSRVAVRPGEGLRKKLEWMRLFGSDPLKVAGAQRHSKLATCNLQPETSCALNIEIVNTGSELMLGLVLNTHQQWLCRQLANLGYTVGRQAAVADDGPAIQAAVREALTRADLVITTGGLGPTSDDLTRDLIAQLLGKKLIEHAAILTHIEKFFAERKRPMPESTRVQALVPEDAIVLPNPHGTAPGLAIAVLPNPYRTGGASSWLVMLPGPPRELRPMFVEQVVPLLQKHFPQARAFVCRTFKTTGLGESIVQEKIAGPLKPLTDAGLVIGYCARTGEVDVRLVASGHQAEPIINEAGRIIRDVIGESIFGVDEEQLEEVIIRQLTERKKTLALAESCTGGRIADRLTNVSGASAVFLAGLVTYSNEAKIHLLGVRPETLAQPGAVSEATAREMAEGARQRNQTDYAIAVTGIAGPTGGTDTKPAGTVFIALATPRATIVKQHLNRYDRETFKQVTSQQALELLRRTLLTEF